MAQRIITVTARDLWVYNVDLPLQDAWAAIAEPDPKWDKDGERVLWPLAVALADGYLDHDFVEPAVIDDLGQPLSDYLHGQTRCDGAQFAADKARLAAAKGLVVMISRDLGDSDLSRNPDAPLTFLGVYRTEPYSFPLGNLPETPKKPTPYRYKPKVVPASADVTPEKMTMRNALTAVAIFGLLVLVVVIFGGFG